jgi:hypothetical protein
MIVQRSLAAHVYAACWNEQKTNLLRYLNDYRDHLMIIPAICYQKQNGSLWVMNFPGGQTITPEIVHMVCDIIYIGFANAGEIRRLLKEVSVD